MILGSGCLGDRSLDAALIRDALEQTGLGEVLLVVGTGTKPGDPSGLDAPYVRTDLVAANRAVSVASEVRARCLIVEPDAGMGVEDTCRRLFDLDRATAGLGLAVLTPSGGPLASPQGMRLVLEDLASRQLGYWHRPARVHQLRRSPASDAAGASGPAEEVWIDELGRWMVGASLDDVAGDTAGLPPGIGELDFSTVTRWRARQLPLALDLAPVPDPGLLRLTLDTLAAAGIT